jgi:hypothetical protein
MGHMRRAPRGSHGQRRSERPEIRQAGCPQVASGATTPIFHAGDLLLRSVPVACPIRRSEPVSDRYWRTTRDSD